MKIIGARISQSYSGMLEQFPRGTNGTLKKKITNLMREYSDLPMDFLIQEGKTKYIKKSSDLIGKVLFVIDESTTVEVHDFHGTQMMEINESLPQSSTVKQLEDIRKISKKTDIGDRVADTEGANLQFLHNPIDDGIESIQDYDNSKFDQSQLKHVSSFTEFGNPIAIQKNKKKK